MVFLFNITSIMQQSNQKIVKILRFQLHTHIHLHRIKPVFNTLCMDNCTPIISRQYLINRLLPSDEYKLIFKDEPYG